MPDFERARAIGPAVEQAYNQLYAAAMQGISAEELAEFTRLFGRMADNFTRAQAQTGLEDHDSAQ